MIYFQISLFIFYYIFNVCVFTLSPYYLILTRHLILCIPLSISLSHPRSLRCLAGFGGGGFRYNRCKLKVRNKLRTWLAAMRKSLTPAAALRKSLMPAAAVRKSLMPAAVSVCDFIPIVVVLVLLMLCVCECFEMHWSVCCVCFLGFRVLGFSQFCKCYGILLLCLLLMLCDFLTL